MFCAAARILDIRTHQRRGNPGSVAAGFLAGTYRLEGASLIALIGKRTTDGDLLAHAADRNPSINEIKIVKSQSYLLLVVTQPFHRCQWGFVFTWNVPAKYDIDWVS